MAAPAASRPSHRRLPGAGTGPLPVDARSGGRDRRGDGRAVHQHLPAHLTQHRDAGQGSDPRRLRGPDAAHRRTDDRARGPDTAPGRRRVGGAQDLGDVPARPDRREPGAATARRARGARAGRAGGAARRPPAGPRRRRTATSTRRSWPSAPERSHAGASSPSATRASCSPVSCTWASACRAASPSRRSSPGTPRGSRARRGSRRRWSRRIRDQVARLERLAGRRLGDADAAAPALGARRGAR